MKRWRKEIKISTIIIRKLPLQIVSNELLNSLLTIKLRLRRTKSKFIATTL